MLSRSPSPRSSSARCAPGRLRQLADTVALDHSSPRSIIERVARPDVLPSRLADLRRSAPPNSSCGFSTRGRARLAVVLELRQLPLLAAVDRVSTAATRLLELASICVCDLASRVGDLALHLVRSARAPASARSLVDRVTMILREVQHPLQRARRDVEQQAQPARRALHEPDVAHRRRPARCGPCARGAPSPARLRRRTCRRRCPCSGRACTCRSSTRSPSSGRRSSRRRARPSPASACGS